MTGLLSFGAHLPVDRVGAPGRRHARCRPDEDAVTLAAQAASAALTDRSAPDALVFASTTAPYDGGGSVQPLAELLGLQGEVFTCELGAGSVDGLAALRLGSALLAGGAESVLVCAAEAHSRGGDAGVALLLGENDTIAELTFIGSFCEEIRDRWRPRGGEQLESDSSFVESIATEHPARELGARAGTGPRLIHGPHPKAAARLERAADGPGDSVAPLAGDLGAAHPLIRLLVDGAGSYSVLAVSGGRAELVAIEWIAAAETAREAIREQLRGGENDGRPALHAPLPEFRPYSSAPRSWRERGSDLRLDGILPPGATVPGRKSPTGTVVTFTVDHVYPGGSPTAVAAIDLEGGGRFFGQVAAGGEVAVGDPVRLVPRRLHDGGGVVQYFWKAEPCR